MRLGGTKTYVTNLGDRVGPSVTGPVFSSCSRNPVIIRR